jgi:hypothetical protein
MGLALNDIPEDITIRTRCLRSRILALGAYLKALFQYKNNRPAERQGGCSILLAYTITAELLYLHRELFVTECI